MPTERCSIGVSQTNRAFLMAKEGHEGPVHIFKHMGREGLQLRIQRNTAAWVVRYKDMSITIGYLYPERSEMPLGGHTAALDLAADMKSVLIDQPERRDEYLLLRYRETTDAKGKTRRWTHGEALAALRPDASTWTFDECIEQTIADKTSPDTPEKDRIGPATVKDYRTTFDRSVWADLKKKPAVLLEPGEIERVRNDVKKNSGTSPAIKAVTYTRAVLNWCARHHAGESGLNKVTPWWQLLAAPYEVKPKTRNPEIEDIVKSLVLAEDYLDKPLPGRSIAKSGVGAGVLAGLWWIVMTCQRGDAALSLKTYNLLDDAERGDGWKIAAWEDEVMKAGQAQMLPIPPRAAAHIEAIRAKAKNHGSKQWAFPSDRDADKHATVSGVYRILYRLAGRDALEQKKPDDWQPRLRKDGTPKKLPSASRTERKDLLAEADVAWWSGHDVRRRLQSVLDLAGIPGGSSVVLAHEMKTSVDLNVSMTQQQREDFMRQRQARITAQAYGGAHFLKLKAEAMQVWTNALLDEYDRQKAAC